jgi:hypothetical protein
MRPVLIGATGDHESGFSNHSGTVLLMLHCPPSNVTTFE